jgi:isopentenyl phosphate kinase
MGSLAVDPRPPVLVKLGGSLITRKREEERVRPKVLARLCREIARVADQRIVVLHGAGSFGHSGALRFGLDRAPEVGANPSDRARGAAIVAAEIRRLHLAVLRELVRAGGAPLSVPLSTHARNREGRPVELDAGPIEAALEAGMTPVSFGDVVPDDAWGFSVLGADTIATELVPILRPARVIFASDVAGVLGPGRSGQRPVIPEVTDEIAQSLAGEGSAPDATGGIRGKALAMRSIARFGVDAVLISGLTDGALSRAIRGEAVYGSWAHARPR